MKNKLFASFLAIVIAFMCFLNIHKTYALTNIDESISYQTHVQDIGWQSNRTNGEIAGTTGRNLQIEALRINNDNKDFEITYQTHVENIGWQGWKNQGELAGTTGRNLQVEAIRINLENKGNSLYRISYRTHVQNIGWQPWKQNGEIAGTTGRNLQVEAIQIKIVKENEFGVAYYSHIENIGWENSEKLNGALSGTTGRNLRNEAISIRLINPPTEDCAVKYSSYVQGEGWQSWKQDGDYTGTTGRALRMEALKLEVVNLGDYSISYRLHIQNIGWTNWAKDGEILGRPGSGLKIEALEIQLEEKNNEEIPSIEDRTVVQKGIDVSTYQDNIDWSKVSKEGINFAMIRAGFRGWGSAGTLVTDNCYRANMEGALGNNIEVGVYFFTQAITEAEAIEEANYVLNLVKGYKITYPIAIDTENVDASATARANNLSVEQRTAVVKAFCETIKNAGYEPMIYANMWWLNHNLDMSQLSSYAVWLAHYTGATQDDPFALPSSYSGKYVMWQYTDSGIINGISGYVDMNVTIPTKKPNDNTQEDTITTNKVTVNLLNNHSLADDLIGEQSKNEINNIVPNEIIDDSIIINDTNSNINDITENTINNIQNEDEVDNKNENVLVINYVE